MSLAPNPPGIPPGCAQDFQRLLAFPLDTQQRMIEALDRYLASARQASAQYPNIDLALAESIAGQLREMLGYDLSHTPELHQKWVQAAARYFFLSDDGAHDWESKEGFADDAEVAAAVARALKG